ncbi:MAG: hypothetical protein PHP93_06990 [Kiritimatiellales bacterium]|nr:hypothetical protein [Kiritimatiellales bacterium]
MARQCVAFTGDTLRSKILVLSNPLNRIREAIAEGITGWQTPA